MDMKPLSREANKRIADQVREILKEAIQNETMIPHSVYEAPEVWEARIDRVGAGIVNFALNVAHEEWSKSAESCAYCLEYEHGMKPASAVTCTCQHHCGAMVCPAGDAFVCRHPAYNEAGHCAEIACENYAGKHVR